ncbi:TonB-dependent receptor [Methylophaga marina]|uniref:TonB-dependent hemoglobin/transferrin/lactoferrin family receptor n=1 Tax=Methylophaga marina TaxID=45495 RepID=A0ABP3DJB0_9GAMM|nr:TonB-dependent hemoglobin/transferrin/lactoferrin family receptor [Methylophaga marina]BDZ74096.1 TonB-dependent receptor [Methylophaga marina]
MKLRKLALLMQVPVLLTVSGGEAFAAEQSLDEITITATRNTDGDSSSRNISVVSQDDIARQQATSVPQVINYLPNVTLTGGPREQVQGVNIRGLGGNRVLQLIDGVRQNFESGHRPTYFLDPSLLKNVEVLRGPSSSLWGSGALGGVVSQNTIHAADLLDGDNLGGFVKQGYQSNGDKWTTTGALASRFGNVDLLLSGYYRDGNDLELGNGDDLENSADRDQGVLAKLDWFIDNDQMATFNFRRSYTDGGVPSNASANLGTSVFLVDREIQTDHASVDYRFNPDNKLIDSQLNLYWNRTEVDENRVSDNRFDTTNIRTLGLNLNNRSQFGDVSVLYGVDGYQDKLDASRSGPSRPIVPEATTDVWGAFTEVQIPFADILRLELGARYDYFATEADNLNNDRSDNAFSPSAAISWLPNEDLQVTLRYDEAFRAPSAEELYTTGTHYSYGPAGANTFINNPNLKPEESQNIEFLVDYQMQNAFNEKDTVNIHASVFHNEVNNFIEQIATNYQQIMLIYGPQFDDYYPVNTEYRNVDKAQLVGFELAMDYQWQNWNAMVSYGQTRAKNKNTGEALANIPADKWVLDLNKSWLSDSLQTGSTLTRVESQKHKPNDVMSANEDYEHYNLVDLYARWTPRDFENLTVDLTVNNLTDQHYRVAFQQLYMPGKDIRLGVKYDF